MAGIWTQADVDAMKAAIRRGVTKVRFGDREVTYLSLAEMRALLGAMQADVNSAAGTGAYRLISTRKGFDS